MQCHLEELKWEQTATLAGLFGEHLRGGEFLGLCGDLGAGKTSFTRELTRALGCSKLANSPTYSLMQSYKGGRLSVLHCDLYRLNSTYELEDLGWLDVLAEYAQGVVVAEWADKFPESLPPDHLLMEWSYGREEETRSVSLRAQGALADTLLEMIQQNWVGA